MKRGFVGKSPYPASAIIPYFLQKFKSIIVKCSKIIQKVFGTGSNVKE